MGHETRDRTVPRVGIVGAGQLARMTHQAAIALGLDLRILAGDPNESAARVARHVSIGRPDAADDLAAFAAQCDVLTFDHELVDIGLLRALAAAGHRLYPSPDTVAVAQDKGLQRALFSRLGLPVPPHARVSDIAQIGAFAHRYGWPVVLKACSGGYDGRGVWVVRDIDSAGEVAAQADEAGLELQAEAWVPIERELAVLVARRPDGETVDYPVVETVQLDGICREVLAPAPISAELATAAREMGTRVARAVDVVGMLAVELFVADGRLLINEIATRPHNSGHFSIEGCTTSQFENHLRAVLGWPLGATDLVAPAAVMVNVIATAETPKDVTENLPAALTVPGAHIHLYGKGARPGRKVGHVTALGTDTADARARAARAAALLRGGPWRED